MKNRITKFILGLALSLLSISGYAQTNAVDFNRMDCNGNMQHLFADLDAGNAVILEFFMQNCNPCITAGTKLEAMKADLLAEFPGKIKSYATGFNNTYSCASNANWVSTNGFTSIPMDSGAAQVAYYGGMGMPTIVIVGGGSNHTVLGAPYLGFSTSDTTMMAMDIRNFLNAATAVADVTTRTSGITVYPNPSNGTLTFRFNAPTHGDLSVQALDLTGRLVMPLLQEQVAAGEVVRTLNTSAIAAGSYLIQVRHNGAVYTQKFAVTR